MSLDNVLKEMVIKQFSLTSIKSERCNKTCKENDLLHGIQKCDA